MMFLKLKVDFVTHLLQILHQLLVALRISLNSFSWLTGSPQFPSTFATSPPCPFLPQVLRAPALFTVIIFLKSITLTTCPPDTLHLTAHTHPCSHPLLQIHTLPSRIYINVNSSRFFSDHLGFVRSTFYVPCIPPIISHYIGL